MSYESEGVVENVGDATETGKRKEGMDPIFEMNVIKFFSDQPYTLTQTVQVLNSAEKLKGYLTYMVCNDVKCLPPTDVDFEVDFQSGLMMLAADLPEETTSLAIIEGDIIDQRRPDLYSTYKQPVASCGETVIEQESLFWMFIFGFLGGLLALLTPCVFPMIPLTVSFFTKETKKKGWVNALIYSISIVVIYVSMGILITVVF